MTAKKLQEGKEYYFIGIPNKNDWANCRCEKLEFKESFRYHIGFEEDNEAYRILAEIKSLFEQPKYEQVPKESKEKFWRIIVSNEYDLATITVKQDDAEAEYQINFKGNCFKKEEDAKKVVNEIRRILDLNKVTFYDQQKRFGFISSLYFFSYSDVKQEMLSLLNSGYYKNEPVVFDIETDKKGVKAININIDFEKRNLGYLVFKEVPSGESIPCVRDMKTEEVIQLYREEKKYPNGKNRFINFEDFVDTPVIFSYGKDKYGEKATNWQLIETRPYILRLCDFRKKIGDENVDTWEGFKRASKDLRSTFCKEESWNYHNPANEDPIFGGEGTNNESLDNDCPVLYSYLNQTFKRVIEENKLIFGLASKTGTEFAYFNTGLANEEQEEVFAYFKKNNKYKETQSWGLSVPKWYFLKFDTRESKYRRYFDITDALPAQYFAKGTPLHLEPEDLSTAQINMEHLWKRKERVANNQIKNMKRDEFDFTIHVSIDLAVKRIRRNYKTVIPFFYSNEIQYLVPMYTRNNKRNAVAAMVVRKQERMYEISTILTLAQAYNNARLLAKPDREWLNP